MLPYFYITGFIAVMALFSPVRRVNLLMWGLTFTALLIFVGLRHKVGMDWNNYLLITDRIGMGSFHDAISDRIEPGFSILTLASTKLNFGVYGVNFVGTIILLIGLFKFTRITPYPWIALLAAMPILVTVVAMSASRQIIAIGIILWLISEWNSAGILKKIIFVLVAFSFHRSAIIFLIAILFQSKLPTYWKYPLSLIFLTITFFFLEYTGTLENYDSLYLSGQTTQTISEAALLHVIFNAGPAILVLCIGFLREELQKISPLILVMALCCILLVPISFVYSTAAARISMYFYPVSMLAFALLPKTTNSTEKRILIRCLIAIILIIILLVWLIFSNSGHAYIPYGNVLTTPSNMLKLCC